MMPSSIFLGTEHYWLESKLAEAFHIARLLGKPLLLEGEPGTGKTKLAQEFAKSQQLPLFEIPITSETKLSHLISKFDDVQRLMDAQATVANAQLKQMGIEMTLTTGERKVDRLEDYVHLGPLAKAFVTPHSVLLLDEMDKAPRELPNNLLFVLSERRIVIPETRQVIECSIETMPIIIITSNHEQDLPAPFVRRCVYAYLEFPEPERLKTIVRMHHPQVNDELLACAIHVFYQLRELGLTRQPSTAEVIDWIAYLLEYNITTPAAIERLEGSSTLIKHREDGGLLKEIQQRGISGVSRKNRSW